MKRYHLCNSHAQKPFLFEISDPAQPGQIIRVDTRGSYQSPQTLAINSRLFMFEYANQNARTDYFFVRGPQSISRAFRE
jgi:hypothetical protein